MAQNAAVLSTNDGVLRGFSRGNGAGWRNTPAGARSETPPPGAQGHVMPSVAPPPPPPATAANSWYDLCVLAGLDEATAASYQVIWAQFPVPEDRRLAPWNDMKAVEGAKVGHVLKLMKFVGAGDGSNSRSSTPDGTVGRSGSTPNHFATSPPGGSSALAALLKSAPPAADSHPTGHPPASGGAAQFMAAIKASAPPPPPSAAAAPPAASSGDDSDDEETKVVKPAQAGLSTADKRKLVLLEVVNTERDYCNDLELILEVYQKPIVERGLLNQIEVATIFSNIPELVGINREFLKLLDASKAEAGADVAAMRVAADFLRMVEPFKRYSRYFTDQAFALSTLEKCQESSPAFGAFLKENVMNPKCRGLSFFSFLIKPVQRICKYPLLLRELLKVTPENHPDYAALQDAMREIEALVTTLNEKKRSAETQTKILELMTSSEGLDKQANFVKNMATRYFILEADFKVGQGKKGSKHKCLLFSDLVLYMQPPKDKTKKLEFGGIAPLNQYSRVVDIADTDDDKNIFAVRHADGTAVFVCSTPEEKKKWVKEIRARIGDTIKKELKSKAATEDPSRSATPPRSTGGRPLAAPAPVSAASTPPLAAASSPGSSVVESLFSSTPPPSATPPLSKPTPGSPAVAAGPSSLYHSWSGPAPKAPADTTGSNTLTPSASAPRPAISPRGQSGSDWQAGGTPTTPSTPSPLSRSSSSNSLPAKQTDSGMDWMTALSSTDSRNSLSSSSSSPATTGPRPVPSPEPARGSPSALPKVFSNPTVSGTRPGTPSRGLPANLVPAPSPADPASKEERHTAAQLMASFAHLLPPVKPPPTPPLALPAVRSLSPPPNRGSADPEAAAALLGAAPTPPLSAVVSPPLSPTNSRSSTTPNPSTAAVVPTPTPTPTPAQAAAPAPNPAYPAPAPNPAYPAAQQAAYPAPAPAAAKPSVAKQLVTVVSPPVTKAPVKQLVTVVAKAPAPKLP